MTDFRTFVHKSNIVLEGVGDDRSKLDDLIIYRGDEAIAFGLCDRPQIRTKYLIGKI